MSKADRTGKVVPIFERGRGAGKKGHSILVYGLAGQAVPDRINPRMAAAVLPGRWTSAKVRKNARGEVQIRLKGKAAKQAKARITGAAARKGKRKL